jgi:glycosyltransferase involved in cell wall biosynthesis
MNLKEIAKKSALLYWVNAKLKCYQLKRDLARLTCEYSTKARARKFVYDAQEAVAEFKRRHQLYCPKFSPRAPGDLRVFWVGTNQSQDESGFLQALQRICTVTVFTNIEGEYGIWSGNPKAAKVPSFAEIREANAETLLRQVTRAQEEGGVDVLLGQMWAWLIPKEALMRVQAMGIPVINISMDDRLPAHWSHRDGVRLGSIGLAPGLDIVLTTSSETCLWFGVEDCPALFWPLASDPEIFAPDEGAVRDIDVLFIGNRYGVRGKLVSYLEDHGIQVTCYGSGWPNGYADAKQNGILSKRARIVLGVGTVGHCADVYTLKLRDFDALMTGALYVTHRNPDLCKIFKEGHEIECYTSNQEAVQKICYYLAHPKEREEIGRMGQLTVLNRHTWDYRLVETFRQLGLLSVPAGLDNASLGVN